MGDSGHRRRGARNVAGVGGTRCDPGRAQRGFDPEPGPRRTSKGASKERAARDPCGARARRRPARARVAGRRAKPAGPARYAHPEAGDELREYDFTGVHLIEPELLAEIPTQMGCMVGDIYGPLMQAGEQFNVSVMEGFWAALDTPELFLETTRRVLEEPWIFEQAPLPDPETKGQFIYNRDQIDAKAHCTSPVLLGLYAHAHAGAQIGPNAVIDGCELQPGASVQNAVLYGMGSIDGEWKDCVAVAGKVAQSRAAK